MIADIFEWNYVYLNILIDSTNYFLSILINIRSYFKKESLIYKTF